MRERSTNTFRGPLGEAALRLGCGLPRFQHFPGHGLAAAVDVACEEAALILGDEGPDDLSVSLGEIQVVDLVAVEPFECSFVHFVGGDLVMADGAGDLVEEEQPVALAFVRRLGHHAHQPNLAGVNDEARFFLRLPNGAAVGAFACGWLKLASNW